MTQLWEDISAKYPRYGHLVTANSVGEAVAVAGFAKALCNSIGKPLALWVPPGFSKIIERLYPGRFHQIVEQKQSMLRSASTAFPRSHSNVFPTNPLSYKGSDTVSKMHDLFYLSGGQRGLSQLDLYRFMLGLDPTIPWELPSVNSLLVLSPELEAKAFDNAALFFIGNNTNYPLKAPFWLRLEEMCESAGLDAYFCVKGSMIYDRLLSFRRTQRLDLSMTDVLAAANISKKVFSCTNGLLQTAALCGSIHGSKSIYNFFVPDKRCVRYGDLTKNFETAFEDYYVATMYGGEPLYRDKITNVCERRFSANFDAGALEALAEQSMVDKPEGVRQHNSENELQTFARSSEFDVNWIRPHL